MHSYAKFLKKILSKKRKPEEFGIMALTKQCSVILQHKLPPKLKHPSRFSIHCDISNLHIDETLYDLIASVSLMPLSIYQKLKLGELKSTTISLQLVE